MRLKIDVRDGDWAVVSYGPYGVRFARLLSERLGVEGHAGDTEEQRCRRWADVAQACLQGAMEVSTPEALTVGELKDLCLAEAHRRKAARTAYPPPVLRTWLADPVTDERLDESWTLAEAELADGDLLVLCIEREPRACYSMSAARNPAALLEKLQLTANAPAPESGPRLWGLLLYTDADHELATYVRTHFDDLHALSGPATQVFVVERRAHRGAAKRYWRTRLEPELYRPLAGMQWLRWQPYDPQGAYALADRLGIEPGLLPCLVFVGDPRGGLRDSEKIIFPVEQSTVGYFRSLFGGIARVLKDPAEQTGPRAPVSEFPLPPDSHPLNYQHSRLDEAQYASPEEMLRRIGRAQRAAATDAEAFARIRAASGAIRAALRPATEAAGVRDLRLTDCHVVITSGGSGSMTENFYFQGTNTTFINRPTDTVVRDFQNSYPSVAGVDELSRLLQLVLNSRDLSDTDRDEAAGVVHDLARLTAEPAPDQPAVRGRLERLRAMVAAGADIAQPALAVVASLTALFTG
ncbi:hypothetical protein [Streptomyces sp. NPDC048516]|uniref:hypothetical protein n=1 Tax=Streptomyces sp. NPDC048516 TaxID=3365565 RepID=UPI00371A7595